MNFRKFFCAGLAVVSAASLAACVPDQQSTSMLSDPIFTVADEASIDFLQLHNDVVDSLQDIYDAEPFVFISEFDISGNDTQRSVTVSASALDGSTKEDAEAFASAVLCMMNDAAAEQYPAFETSGADSFGTFYDTYSLQLDVTDESGNSLCSLSVPAGEEIPLDPDYGTYVDDWYREYQVYMEHAVYDVNGNIISAD